MSEVRGHTGPRLPKTPLELLNNDGTREAPWFNQFFLPTVCGVLAFGGSVFANYATKRPLMSGIQRYVIAVGGAVAVGKIADDYRESYFADRDAMYRHYIQLHPEDFPPYERKKFGEVLEPWLPIR